MADQAVVLFDGVCNLCNGAVQFILKRDPVGYFQFASLQSKAAGQLLGSRPALDSIVLVMGGEIHTKSGAALRIARKLRFPWPLLSVFLLVPSPIRDAIYNGIARNRYRWFGRRGVCMIPAKEFRVRFLDNEDPDDRV